MERLVNAVDAPDFISAVERHPVLWDCGNLNYTDRGIKKKAWEEVMSNFVNDFQERTSLEKKQLGLACLRKWKSLRDCFTRELSRKRKAAKEGTESARKEYVYFENLKFLEPAIKIGVNITNEDGEGTHDFEYVDASNIRTETESPFPKRSKRVQGLGKMAAPPTGRHTNTKTQKPVDVPIERSFDSDRGFMLSLVPELKKLPERMKIEVKRRLLNVFLEVQEGLKSQGTSVHPTSFGRSQNQPHATGYNCQVQTQPLLQNYQNGSVTPVQITIPISISLIPNRSDLDPVPDVRTSSKIEIVPDYEARPVSPVKSEPVSDFSECDFAS